MPKTKEAFEEMRETARKKIESAALSLFAKKGLLVTVDEISQKAGLSKGLLYNYYPSKEALILELVRQATAISSKAIGEMANSDGIARDKIKQITYGMCGMLQTGHPGIENFMFMIQVGMTGIQTSESSLHSDNSPSPTESLARIIAQGQAEGTVVTGDPLQLSTTYWATIQGLCCYSSAGMPISLSNEMLNRILLKESFL